MYTLSYFNRKGDRHSIEIAKGDLLPVLLSLRRLRSKVVGCQYHQA
jgi:hypothetical protein